MKNLLFALTISLFSLNIFGQSAWNLKEKSWYVQLNYTRIGPYSDLFINGNETKTIPREIEDNTIQFYGEYGLNDKTTISLSLPIKFIKTGSQTTQTDPLIAADNVTAPGNIGLGVKRNLYNKGVVISAGLAIEANTGYYDDPSGIRTGYDAWTFTPAVFFGKGFNKFFVQGSVSTGYRTNNYSHFFRGGAEAGYKFINGLWTIFYLEYKASFKNGTIRLPDNNLTTSLYVDNQEYTGYGLKAIYQLNKQLGLTLGLGGAFSANAEARKAALNIGVFMKLDAKK